MIAVRQVTDWKLGPVNDWLRAAYRFVFPPTCPLCGVEMASLTLPCGGRQITPVLCADCAAALAPPPNHSCSRCGAPVGQYARSADGCPHCRSRDFRFDRVIRFGLYEDSLREAIIGGKSPHAQPLSAALANQFWQSRHGELLAEHIDLVAPVPRYWTRRVWHDHNQSETLASVLARQLNVPFCRSLLHKVKLTPDQSDLSAADRKLNLHGAFSVWAGRWRLKAKTVLLVDDILTTGTTANECAKILLRAGASRVVVAVLAVVPPPRR